MTTPDIFNDNQLEKLRKETPGVGNVLHFNNAGASLMAEPVHKKMVQYLDQEMQYGGYETARARAEDIEATYNVIADFINADPDEIALVENATVAWQMAFFSVDFEPGDRILTSVSEYASNYINYLRLQNDIDVSVEVIPNTDTGEASVEALEEMMDEHVRLISITHIPTNSGLVNPAEEIGKVARKYNCLYLLDACQSVGHYPVDVEKIGCDMLSATGRKYLRGPRGTGFLYVNKDRLNQLHPPFLDLHSAEWTGKSSYKVRDDARRFENWETNFSGVIGLKAATEYAADIGIHNIWNRIQKLAEQLREKLDSLDGVTVQDIGKSKCGIVTFSIENRDAVDIRDVLNKQGININVASKSSTLIDMSQRNLREVIRASVHYYNTEDEIERFVEALDWMLDAEY